jgi:hypothetical protein
MLRIVAYPGDCRRIYTGSSVMNPLGGKDDLARNIPNKPTACDVKMAIKYSTP